MEGNSQCKLSVVIVYTNTEKLNEAISWLNKQSIACDVEQILLDNRNNRFSSAASALNYGAQQAQGDIVVFMHQDVYLWDLNALEKYRDYLLANKDEIIGVAGVPAGMTTVTDIVESRDGLERGNRANGKAYEVDALDECLFAMMRSRWEKLKFDEICCDNWHGYGMDICFSNTLACGRNIMVPLRICHESTGNPLTKSFRMTMKNLIKKYHGTAINRIHGCCIDLPCSWTSFYWYCFKENVKAHLRNVGLNV